MTCPTSTPCSSRGLYTSGLPRRTPRSGTEQVHHPAAAWATSGSGAHPLHRTRMCPRRICRAVSQRLSLSWRNLGRTDKSSTRRPSSGGRRRSRGFSRCGLGGRRGSTRAARPGALPARSRTWATRARKASRTCTRRCATARSSTTAGTTCRTCAQTWHSSVVDVDFHSGSFTAALVFSEVFVCSLARLGEGSFAKIFGRQRWHS